MYKTKDLTPEDLSKIKIKNQAEILQYIGSELDPKEAFNLIKKESNGFTQANAKAEEADALLFAISQGKALTIPSKMTTKLKNIPKEEAILKFKEGIKVYAIGDKGQELLIESEGIFSLANTFAIKTEVEEKLKSDTLSNEQIRILKVKKETELALLGIKLRRKKKQNKSVKAHNI
jgi:hypothetical protein